MFEIVAIEGAALKRAGKRNRASRMIAGVAPKRDKHASQTHVRVHSLLLHRIQLLDVVARRSMLSASVDHAI